jgi:hypothetical protein
MQIKPPAEGSTTATRRSKGDEVTIQRPRATYANVTSTLALVAALATGGAYAADKIGTGDIKRNAVTSSKINNGAVKTEDLARRAVTQRRIAPRAVTNGKIGPGAVSRDRINFQAVGCDQLDLAVQASIAACN